MPGAPRGGRTLPLVLALLAAAGASACTPGRPVAGPVPTTPVPTTPAAPSVTGASADRTGGADLTTGRPSPDAVARAIRSPRPAPDELIRLSDVPGRVDGSLPRTRPAVGGTRYDLDVGCSATVPGLRRTVFVTAGVRGGGLEDSDVTVPTDCDGTVRTVPFVPRVDGDLSVSWTDVVSSGQPSLTGFVVVVRPARPAGSPTGSARPRRTPAPPLAVPPLATPPIAATQAARTTSQTGVGLGTVTRGRRYEVAAACTSVTPGRLATWEIAQPGFSGSDGADDSVASGSFPCTGAVQTSVHTLVVSGTVFLAVDVGRAAPGPYWVTVSPWDGP